MHRLTAGTNNEEYKPESALPINLWFLSCRLERKRERVGALLERQFAQIGSKCMPLTVQQKKKKKKKGLSCLDLTKRVLFFLLLRLLGPEV